MNVGSLFSGIGGIDLGLQRAGFDIAWQCERDEWCRKILTKHWPEVPKYDDVQTLDAATVEPVDLLAGGFPCQDLSSAGKRAGLKEGTRSGLWFEFARIIRALRPNYVLVENVPGLLVHHGLGIVLRDLAECGYDAEWDCLAASSFGAPHARERIWIVAYPKGLYEQKTFPPRITQKNEWHAPYNAKVRNKLIFHGTVPANPWEICEPSLSGVHDGVPSDMDRIKGLGNAVVPQIVEWIGKRIMEIAHNA